MPPAAKGYALGTPYLQRLDHQPSDANLVLSAAGIHFMASHRIGCEAMGYLGFASLPVEIVGFQPMASDPAKGVNGFQRHSPWPPEALPYSATFLNPPMPRSIDVT